MRLFPDKFTGTFLKTLDGRFRKTNPLADTYRFGGGKRRQEGKQFGVPLVQHPDFHFRRYTALHGAEIFVSRMARSALSSSISFMSASPDAAHDLNDQTEADEVGFQFYPGAFSCLAF